MADGAVFNPASVTPATRRALDDIGRRLRVQEENIINGTIVAGAVIADRFLVVDPISKTRRMEFGEANFDEGATESALIFYARDGDDDNMNISWVHGIAGQQTMTMGAEPLGADQHMAAGIKIQVTDDNSINRATLKGGRGDAQVSVNEGAAQMTYWNSTQSAPTYVLLNELSYSSRAESHTWFAGWDSVDPEMLNGDNAMMLMDDQARLWLNNRNAASDGRPWVSFANLNASGTSVRKGYIGYPENNSNTSSLYMTAETGNLQLSAAGGSLILTGAGNDIIQLASTAHFQWGSAANPSITFSGDDDTGMYRDTTNSIGWSVGGVEVMQVGTSALNFGAAATGQASIRHKTPGVTTPTYSFAGDTNTGMYRDGSNSLSFATGGVQRLDVDAGGIKGKVSFSGPAGSVATPSFNFDGDTNTGMYRYGSDNIGMTVGGRLATQTENNGFRVVGPNRGQTLKTWAYAHIIAMSQDGTGNDNTNDWVGIALWAQRPGIAPLARVHKGAGEAWGFVNSANSAFINIWAAGITINSTERVKKNLKVVEDDKVIGLAEKWLMSEFDRKERPKQVVPTAKFKDIDERWRASGKSPLKADPAKHTQSEDHDCSTGGCPGSADNPCSVVLNDNSHWGGLAEWWGEVAPNQVHFDEGGVAEGIHVEQIASTALGAAGALSRRLQDALDRIDILEGKTPAPRAKGPWVK